MSYKDGMTNVFQDNNAQDMGAAIFGDEIPASGRRVAKPYNLLDIWPDPRQPRRAIPAVVRGDGDPAGLGDVLLRWYMRVKDVVQDLPDMKLMLAGLEEWPIEDDPRGIVQSLGELVNLAAGIDRDGLINPITVYEHDNRLWCLTGERRLLAHHLLQRFVDHKEYSKILAVKTDYSVMQQVAENTQRRDLNAIGMARCYALVVLELAKKDGVRFSSYEVMTAKGRSDLFFYGQATNIKTYGKGKDIQTALNVNNRQSIAQYRLLLTLPEEVWQQADEEDWSLRQCMDWLDSRKPKMTPPPNTKAEPVAGAGSTRQMDQTDVLIDNSASVFNADELKQNSNGNVNRDLHFPVADEEKTEEMPQIGGQLVTKSKQTPSPQQVREGEQPHDLPLVRGYPAAMLVLGLLQRIGQENDDDHLVRHAKYYATVRESEMRSMVEDHGAEAIVSDIAEFVNDEANVALQSLWDEFLAYIEALKQMAQEV